MTELSKTILNKYLVRKTKQQKSKFINLIEDNFECIVEASKVNRNIVIGDVKTAKVVYTAHYDTPARLPFPNFITPKSLFWVIAYQLLIAAILLIPMGCAYWLCDYLFELLYSDEMNGVAFSFLTFITSFGPLLVMFLISYLVLNGPANKSNANDNTSGIITLIELYNKMSDEAKKECAFVFFDNEEKGLLGSRYFKKLHKEEMHQFVLINFDCVGSGDNFLLAYNKKARLYYKDNIIPYFEPSNNKSLVEDGGFCFYPSDQIGFTNNIGVATLKKNKVFGFYIDKIHTKHDKEFDEENINYLTDSFNKYQESLLNKQ